MEPVRVGAAVAGTALVVGLVGVVPPAAADPVLTPRWVVVVDGEQATSVTGTAMGNHRFTHVVAVGTFSGEAMIGDKRLRSAGGQDGFVAALDHDGHPRWVLPIGGKGFDAATAVATGVKGDVYVTGRFDKSMRIGATTLSARTTATFVARLGSEGDVVWARVVPSARGTNDGTAIAVNERGRVAVTGHFQGVITVPTASGVRKVTSYGWKGDGFTLRLSNTGRFEWIRSVGIDSYQTLGTGVVLDADGDVFATYRSWDSEFGDSFGALAKYSGKGKVYWTAGPTVGLDYVGLDLDPDGNAVVAGTIWDWNVDVGGVAVAAQNVPAMLVVTHASRGGAATRVLASSGPGRAEATGVAVDAAGVPTVAGRVDGTVTFGPLTLTTSEETGALTRWAADGVPMWAVATGPDLFRGPWLTQRGASEVITSGQGWGGSPLGGQPLPGSDLTGFVVQWEAVVP